MAVFLRINLVLVAFGISFLGAAFCVMWAAGSWEAWALLFYAVPLALVLLALRNSGRSLELRAALQAFALACPVLLAVISYGRLTLTIVVGTIALSVLVVILCRGFGPMGKLLPVSWIAAFVLPATAFFFDHAIFCGRIFVFKWSQIEHPFWSPYQRGSPEQHGPKAIYVYDMNGMDPAAVALVWGWSVYPKFVDLGERRPEGPLLAVPAIQEVLR